MTHLIGFYNDFKQVMLQFCKKLNQKVGKKKPTSKIYLPRNNPGDVSSNLNDNAVDS